MTHTRKVLTASDLSTGDTLERCVVTGDCTGLVCTAVMCDLTGTTGVNGWKTPLCLMPEHITPEPTPEEILAEQVAERATNATNAMREALLKAAPIEATVGLYNSDGVERIKKAGE